MSEQKTLDKWTPKPRNRKARLVIYDFDGTIFNSPDRPEGETAYFEATGQTFPFSGWWGRKETLLPPIVPQEPGSEWYIERTVNAFREDAKRQDTELILMTGRPFKNRKRIIELCELNQMVFHGHYFRGQPGQKGRDTLEIKSNFITEDLMHEGLTVIEIWEDRPEHTSAFFNLARQWKKKYKHLEKIIIHDVLQGTSNVV